MRSTGVLVATLALVAAGCGTSARESDPMTTTSFRPVPHAWAAARDQARDLRAATYDIVTTDHTCSSGSADVPCDALTVTLSEHGFFTEEPDTLNSVVRIERSPEPSTEGLANRADLRQLADGTLFMRNDFVAGNCWYAAPRTARDYGLAKLDAALKVLRNAYVPDDGPSTGSPIELEGRAPAMDVLKALGLLLGQSQDQVFPQDQAAELQGVQVPIHVSINADGSPRGFTVRGIEVSAFLTGAFPDPPRAYAISAQTHDVSFRLSKIGVRRQVATPAADDIRPTDAPDDFTCEKS